MGVVWEYQKSDLVLQWCSIATTYPYLYILEEIMCSVFVIKRKQGSQDADSGRDRKECGSSVGVVWE